MFWNRPFSRIDSSRSVFDFRIIYDRGTFLGNLVRFVDGFVIIFGARFFKDSRNCFLLNLQLTEQGSDKQFANICQGPPRSAKINETIAKHETPSATCRNESRKRQAPKLREQRCHAACRLQYFHLFQVSRWGIL